jgi:hypothetical protein
MVEPWLAGPLAGIDPLLSPLFYSFAQARQEFADATDGLTTSQIWARPHRLAPVGFHIRHAGGAVDRLGTYLQGRQLSDSQMSALGAELEPGASRQQLLDNLDAALSGCEQYVRTVHVESLREPREVGRKRLPTTVHGLIVHIAEHTMRHVGQAVTTAKLVRALGVSTQ